MVLVTSLGYSGLQSHWLCSQGFSLHLHIPDQVFLGHQEPEQCLPCPAGSELTLDAVQKSPVSCSSPAPSQRCQGGGGPPRGTTATTSLTLGWPDPPPQAPSWLPGCSRAHPTAAGLLPRAGPPPLAFMQSLLSCLCFWSPSFPLQTTPGSISIPKYSAGAGG